MMQARLPKFRRVPEAVAGKPITARGLEIIQIILRYRFIATSTLIRVAGGNEDVTYRHLQQLYHQGVISRFTLPRHGNKGEFIYFLDNVSALREISHKLATEEMDWAQIKANRGKYSAENIDQDGYGQFLFICHELMISDFHASLETTCRASGGRVELARWVQGATLWSKVQVSRKLTLPHRPDAFFTLYFPNAPAGAQRSNFFYEADRGTTNLTRFSQKLLAYFEYLKQGKQESLGIKKVRAVLIETITEQRAEQCREVAARLAGNEPLAGIVFWFAKQTETNGGEPEFPACWQAASDSRLRSLTD